MTSTAFLYHLIIDPMLKSLRKEVAGIIPADASVLEVACGTGDQAQLLAREERRILGIDRDAGMIAFACRRISAEHEENLTFRVADARNLDFLSAGEFDFALVTLALHAMEDTVRLSVLKELTRVARTLVLVDYSCPMPSSSEGMLIQLIEFLAGKSHHRAFRDYQVSGGLNRLLEDAGLGSAQTRTILGGTVLISLCTPVNP